jgi:hypothetical protein
VKLNLDFFGENDAAYKLVGGDGDWLGFEIIASTNHVHLKFFLKYSKCSINSDTDVLIVT